MTDVLVDGDVFGILDQGKLLWGPYFISPTTCAVVFIQATTTDVVFARTTNAGDNPPTWATTVLHTGTDIRFAAWFDQETPGDTGTLVHVLIMDALLGDNMFYRSFDISDASLGTLRTVDAVVTISSTSTENQCAITKTRSGNLVAAFSTQSEIECYRSTDSGATWTDRADVFETTTEEDHLLLFPANTGDDDDACAVFWDKSADEISLKMYDESADTWTEFATLIAATAVDDPFQYHIDGAVRHSDSHVLVAWHSDNDTTGDDIETADLTVDSIASPTVTAKTNVVTNQAGSGAVGMLINQQNDDVYVAYCKGGTWQSLTDVVFHKSTDGMGVWGTEQAYTDSASDDFRLASGGRTVGDGGGRFMPVWYDDDETEIRHSDSNDVEIAAASTATSLLPRYGHPMRHLIGR
ncbi:hypothetical protein LCGC14_1082840 [marine sediment metagenome]|uniref:Sialidase domain-containing protein n=1 Tax=marine sediment metagenome TaxID=412755 RepID=A0A0F9MEV1_9ZZZZ